MARGPGSLSLENHLETSLFWFVLALIVRLAYLQEQSGHFTFYQQMLDEREVAETARNGFPEGEPYFKAPLYVFFIRAIMAISGDAWVWLVRLIQHCCGALLVVLAFDASRRLTKSTPAAAIVAGMLCFYGPLIRLEDRLILDFFTVFLQSAMLWAMLRIPDEDRKLKWALIAGAFAGLSWLNRPTIMPVLPILAMWIFMHRRPWKPNLKLAAVYLILPMVAIGGFALRNHRVSGEALTTPWQGGYNFFMANKQGANGRYLIQEGYVTDHHGNPTKAIILAGPNASGKTSYNSLNRSWFNQGFEDITEDVPAWMGLMVRKAFYLVTAREIFNFEDYRVVRDLSRILKLSFFNFGWLWPLAFASLAFWKTWRNEEGLAGLYLLFLGGAIALFFTSGRLRMPLVFPVAMLAAVTLAGVIKQPKQLAVWALLAAGLALSWVDWWGVRSEDHLDNEYLRISNAAWRAGEFEAALDYADRAVALKIMNPQIHQVRGQALHGVGRIDDAIKSYERAIASQPNNPSHRINLGMIYYYEKNDLERADALLKNTGNGMNRVAWIQARILIRQGKIQAAQKLLTLPIGLSLNEIWNEIDPRGYLISSICLAASKGDQEAVKNISRQLNDEFGANAMEELARELSKLPKATSP